MAKKNRMSQAAPDQEPPAQEPSGLVKMVRSAEDANGGPTAADVHPGEVAAWKAAGWKTE